MTTSSILKLKNSKTGQSWLLNLNMTHRHPILTFWSLQVIPLSINISSTNSLEVRKIVF